MTAERRKPLQSGFSRRWVFGVGEEGCSYWLLHAQEASAENPGCRKSLADVDALPYLIYPVGLYMSSAKKGIRVQASATQGAIESGCAVFADACPALTRSPETVRHA
jgi:hypothetical protein